MEEEEAKNKTKKHTMGILIRKKCRDMWSTAFGENIIIIIAFTTFNLSFSASNSASDMLDLPAAYERDASINFCSSGPGKHKRSNVLS